MSANPPLPDEQPTRMVASTGANPDRLDAAWFIDKLVQVLVFIGGISAIIFVIGIFVFVTKEAPLSKCSATGTGSTVAGVKFPSITSTLSSAVVSCLALRFW